MVRESGPDTAQGPGCVTTSMTLLGLALVWTVQPAELSKISVDREAFRVLQGLSTPRLSWEEIRECA